MIPEPEPGIPPEIETEEIVDIPDPEPVEIETESKPVVEEIVIPKVEEEKKEPLPVLPVVVSLLVGLSGSSGALFLFFLRRRKVTGTIVDADGERIEGIRVMLDDREAFTNEKGEFVFRGMKRGNHDFCVYRSSDCIVLSMSICTEKSEDSEVFTILKDSCLNVDTHKEGKNYLIDVVMAE